MRYYELIESNYDELQIDRSEILAGAEQIKQHCQPYLQAIKGSPHSHPLFRGVKYENETVIRKEVRLTGRRPQDVEDDIHDLLNDYFDTKFGEPYRNAMFAAGTPGVAASFGDLYLVFPAGPFTFIWSTEVTDFQSDGHAGRLEDIISNLETGIDQYEWDSIEKYLDALEYQNDELLKAINSQNEIMFRCKEYYGIRIEAKSIYRTAAIDQILRILTDALH